MLITLLSILTIFNSKPQFIAPIADDYIISHKAEVLSAQTDKTQENLLANHSLDLSMRHEKPSINEIFKDNILLSLHYLNKEKPLFYDRKLHKNTVDWQEINKPFEVSFSLKPNEVFAFHANVLKEYEQNLVYTMNSVFGYEEGYKTSGSLYGDGVCHLASLINWTSIDAGLETKAFVDHNFSIVAGVPKKYGTSISYSKKGNNSQNQNLYIRNIFAFPVEFRFKANSEIVELKIIKI